MNKYYGIGENDNPCYNENVAVKVLHPNVNMNVEVDLQILCMITNALEFLFNDLKWISLSEEVNTFGHMMRSNTFCF